MPGDDAHAPTSPDPAPAPHRARRLPAIDPRRCTGCGRCVAACEPHLLSLEAAHWRKFAVAQSLERCTSCNLCAVKCPFRAITMRREAATAHDGTQPPPES